MTYQGDDARQGDSPKRISKSQLRMRWMPAITPLKRTQPSDGILPTSRHADQIYALNPDLLHVLPTQAQFFPYGSLDLQVWKPVLPFPNEHFTILHAPRHRQAKGTHYIIEAVNRLIAEGFDIEFILVENMSHDEVQRVYERADLLIDQVLAGWYGGLAVELMALGKPVVCYLREGDLGFIPAAMRSELPIIPATPATLYDTLKLWLGEKRSELVVRGRQGRAYVERWHDPLKLAQELRDSYEQIMRRKISPGVS